MSVETTDDSAPRLVRLRRESADTLALVEGEAVRDLPTDLYIPPDALEVFLETFEGPLDLLLYLIRRENLDILDVKVAEVTQQYMNYVDLMSAIHRPGFHVMLRVKPWTMYARPLAFTAGDFWFGITPVLSSNNASGFLLKRQWLSSNKERVFVNER